MCILGISGYRLEANDSRRQSGQDLSKVSLKNRAGIVAAHRSYSRSPSPLSILSLLSALSNPMISRQMDYNRPAVLIYRQVRANGKGIVINPVKVFEGKTQADSFVSKDPVLPSLSSLPWYKNGKKVAVAAAGMIGLVGGAFLALRTKDSEGICPWVHKRLIAPLRWELPLLSNTNLDDQLSHGGISRAEACKNFLKFLPFNNALFWNQFLGTTSGSSAFTMEQQEVDVGTCLAMPASEFPNGNAAIDLAPVLSLAAVHAPDLSEKEKNEPVDLHLPNPGAPSADLGQRVLIGPQEKSVAGNLKKESNSRKELREKAEKAEKKRLKEEKKLRKEMEKAEEELREKAEKAEKKRRKEALKK